LLLTLRTMTPILRRIIISLVLLLIPATAAQATVGPNASWALGFGSTGTETTRGVTTLRDGSTIVTGSFSGTAWFGATSIVSAGGLDIYIARVNTDGSYAWVRRAGGASDDVGFGVAEGAGGNIFMASYVTGAGTVGTFSLPGRGGADIVIASIDAATGTFQWVTTGGGNGNDYLYRVRPMPDGSMLAVGSHQTTATFGSTTLPTSLGAGDLFVTRIDGDGTFRWTKRLGGSTNFDDLFGFWVFPDGTMAATGYVRGSSTFGSTTITPTGAGSADILLLKLDAEGNVLWARRAGGPSVDDFGYAVSGFPDGSMLVGGYFSGTADFGSITHTSAGGQDAFLAKYSADGTALWVKTGGSAGNDAVRDVVARADGSAIMAITNAGSMPWGSASITGLGGTDSVITTVDGAGDITWHAVRGGSGTDSARQVNARSDGFFTIAGTFSGSASFGGTTLTSRGGEDGFLEGFLLVPDAPAEPVITVGPGYATATVDTSAGASVTNYEITAYPGGNQCDIAPPANSCTITGLQGGTSYAFTTVVTNSAGRSSASTQATAVIPGAPTTEAPASTPAVTTPVAALPRAVVRLSGRLWRVGLRAITAGQVPLGATSVTQSARRVGPSRTSAARAHSPGACVLSGPSWQRRYRCEQRLSPGTWRLETQASDATGVLARMITRVTVKAARAPSVTG
jgi:hypothetical protein